MKPSSARKVDSQTNPGGTRKPLEDTSPSSGPAPTQVEIQQHAYRIHVDRGRQHGNDLDDWLQAERALSEGRRRGPDGTHSAD
jgi:DUF2934 family protein